MKLLVSLFAAMLFSLVSSIAFAQSLKTLELGVGLFQPDKEKNDATYKPIADYLARK